MVIFWLLNTVTRYRMLHPGSILAYELFVAIICDISEYQICSDKLGLLW